MLVAIIGRGLAEYDREIFQSAATIIIDHEPGRCNGGAVSTVAGLGEGKEDPVAGLEIRRQCHIKQAALAVRSYFRDARNIGAGVSLTVDYPHCALLEGHEHAPAGQEFERPDLRQVGCYDLPLDLRQLGGLRRPRLVG